MFTSKQIPTISHPKDRCLQKTFPRPQKSLLKKSCPIQRHISQQQICQQGRFLPSWQQFISHEQFIRRKRSVKARLWDNITGGGHKNKSSERLLERSEWFSLTCADRRTRNKTLLPQVRTKLFLPFPSSKCFHLIWLVSRWRFDIRDCTFILNIPTENYSCEGVLV